MNRFIISIVIFSSVIATEINCQEIKHYLWHLFGEFQSLCNPGLQYCCFCYGFKTYWSLIPSDTKIKERYMATNVKSYFIQILIQILVQQSGHLLSVCTDFNINLKIAEYSNFRCLYKSYLLHLYLKVSSQKTPWY